MITVGVRILKSRTISVAMLALIQVFDDRYLRANARGRTGSLATFASTKRKADRHTIPDTSKAIVVALDQGNVEPPPDIGMRRKIVPEEDKTIPV